MAEKYIQSRKNPLVVRWEKLRDKSRERKKSGSFLVEGLQEIDYALKAGFTPLQALMVEGQSVPPFFSEKVDIITASGEIFDALAMRGRHAGMVVEFATKSLDEPPALGPKPLVLVLDALEKPGNVGALYRSALATGVECVVLTNPLTDIYHPNVIRSSVGCSLRIPTWMPTVPRALEFLKENGIEVLTTALGNHGHVSQQDLNKPLAWVLGNEHAGLGGDWLESGAKKISIPMLQEMDSLNVSVSGAVVLYETLRQRLTY